MTKTALITGITGARTAKAILPSATDKGLFFRVHWHQAAGQQLQPPAASIKPLPGIRMRWVIPRLVLHYGGFTIPPNLDSGSCKQVQPD